MSSIHSLIVTSYESKDIDKKNNVYIRHTLIGWVSGGCRIPYLKALGVTIVAYNSKGSAAFLCVGLKHNHTHIRSNDL